MSSSGSSPPPLRLSSEKDSLSRSRKQLRRMSVGNSSFEKKPAWWVRYFRLGDTKQLKILHDSTNEKAIYNVVRRNSLKKDGLSEEEIKKMMTTEEVKQNRWLIHPESRYRLWWDMLTALSVLYLIWLVPFYVGFSEFETGNTLSALNLFLDVWFIMDVFLNFRTGYVDHGVMVMDANLIAKNYSQTYLFVDVVASVPWEYFIAATSGASTTGGARKSLKLTKYFKIPKLLRMTRVIRFFSKYARFYGLTLAIMFTFTALHFAACGLCWVVDACVNNEDIYISDANDGTYMFLPNTFSDCAELSQTDFDNTPECNLPHFCSTQMVFELYAESLFLSLSMMVGSPMSSWVGGALSPIGCMAANMNKINNVTGVSINATRFVDGEYLDYHNNVVLAQDDVVCPINVVGMLKNYEADSLHFVFVCFVLMIGLANLAVLYGQLGLVLNSRYQASAAFRIKLDRVKAECEYYKVPWDLQNRVFAYYDYLWVNQKQYDDKIMLMNDRGMSSDLRGKLALFLYKDVIQGVSLFERVDDTFLSKICMELQTRVYLPQDWIILKGDIGSELYIIARGIVQVYIDDPKPEGIIPAKEDPAKRRDSTGDAHIFLHAGQFFGEVSLLMETRRTTSVQARTICEVNVLVQEVFEEILRESPEFAEEMKNLVTERKLHNAKRKKHRDSMSKDKDGGKDNSSSSNSSLAGSKRFTGVSLGQTQSRIEAAVVDAIESRQLMSNMRHLVEFDDPESEEEMKSFVESHLDVDAEQAIAEKTSLRSSFIKPIQDQIDQEVKKEEEVKIKAMKSQSAGTRNSIQGPLNTVAEAYDRDEVVENEGQRRNRNSGDMRLMPQLSGRQSRMPSTTNFENNDIVSLQIATLQERTDKVYAMLTTKLGRVR